MKTRKLKISASIIYVKLSEILTNCFKIFIEDTEESTFDDYNSVPVTGFGKAQLKRFGWKDDDPKNTDDDAPKWPQGVGLGAKYSDIQGSLGL